MAGNAGVPIHVSEMEKAYLKATFEMASGGMTALETDEYSVSCSAAAPEGGAPAGVIVPIA